MINRRIGRLLHCSIAESDRCYIVQSQNRVSCNVWSRDLQGHRTTGITVGLAVWGYDNSICEKTGSSNVCAELPTGLAVLGLMVGSKGSVFRLQ